MAQRTSPLRFFLGLFLALAGLLLLFSRLGWLHLEVGLWDLWPLVFFAIGLARLMRREWTGALFFFFLGAAFLAPQILPEVSFRDIVQYWPVLLVFFGVSMVLRSFGRERRSRESVVSKGQVAFLRNVSVYEEDPSYTGVDLTALLGTYKLDLSKAHLAPGGAVLDVFAFWGGIELVVPPGMPVDLRVMPVMGGAEDSSTPSAALPADAPRLTVRGFVFMAGLEVKN